jgi:hypothetical protein
VCVRVRVCPMRQACGVLGGELCSHTGWSWSRSETCPGLRTLQLAACERITDASLQSVSTSLPELRVRLLLHALQELSLNPSRCLGVGLSR